MSTPQRYRKKPVEIEAMRFPETNDPPACHAVYRWVEDNTQGSYEYGSDRVPDDGVSIDLADGLMVIATLEGEMKVGLGDWVIRGIVGEFYPCKPDIFAATYESISATVGTGIDIVERARYCREYGNFGGLDAELLAEVERLRAIIEDVPARTPHAPPKYQTAQQESLRARIRYLLDEPYVHHGYAYVAASDLREALAESIGTGVS